MASSKMLDARGIVTESPSEYPALLKAIVYA